MPYQEKRKSFPFEIMNEIIDRGGKFMAIEPSKMKLIEIDTSKDIDIAKTIL